MNFPRVYYANTCERIVLYHLVEITMLPLARHELDRSARQVDIRSVGLLSTYSWRATVFPPPPWHANSVLRKIEECGRFEQEANHASKVQKFCSPI